jgi:uncharacterized protein YoxC
MENSLETTNAILTVLAVASAVQVLMLLAVGLFAYRAYRRLSRTIEQVESNVRPITTRIASILDDVDRLSTRWERRTERVDALIDRTVDRFTGTSRDVRDGAARGVRELAGVVRGVRDAIAAALTTESDGRRGSSTLVNPLETSSSVRSSEGTASPAGNPAWAGGRHDA